MPEPEGIGRREFTGAWARICWCLALGPFMVLVAMVMSYNVDVPHADQWGLVPLLEASAAGELTFADIWFQHNEHRLVFPRLIMLVMARMSGWNIFWEYGVSVLCALGLFGVAVAALRFAEEGRQRCYWALPLFSLMLFSPSQWQNWYLGWQLQIFLNLLAFAGGMLVLARLGHTRSGMAMAIALGLLATFSFANGLLYWVLGALVLAALWRAGELPECGKRLLLWCVLGALVIGVYLHDYKTPTANSSLGYALSHPHLWACYVCKYLGGALVYVRYTTDFSRSAHNHIALAVGVAGVISYLVLCCHLVRRRDVSMKALAPVVALALYTLASAILAGQGRLVGHGGTGQALSSRYVTIGNLFWISLVILTRMAVARGAEKRARSALTAVLVVVVALLGLSARYGQISWAEREDHLLEARRALRTGENEAALVRLYPDVKEVKRWRATLERLKLSVFRDEE